MTQLKNPLDKCVLDRLTLGTDAAVASYQEQRLKLQSAQKLRDSRQRANLTRTQTGRDDEIA